METELKLNMENYKKMYSQVGDHFNKILQTVVHYILFSRPGQSKGLGYKHCSDLVTDIYM